MSTGQSSTTPYALRTPPRRRHKLGPWGALPSFFDMVMQALFLAQGLPLHAESAPWTQGGGDGMLRGAYRPDVGAVIGRAGQDVGAVAREAGADVEGAAHVA